MSPVDYVIVGLGQPQEEFRVSRLNAGYIFTDYLANCISMQALLIEKANLNATANPGELTVPEGFKRPEFIRRTDLYCDLAQLDFFITESDLNPKSTNPSAETSIARTLKFVIVKPLTEMHECGHCVEKVLKHYNVGPEKLIVVLDDLATLPGAISIQGSGDKKGFSHKGLTSIKEQTNHDNFVRLRIGIGRPSTEAEQGNYLFAAIPQENREVDLFGYALDVAGQALQHYVSLQDIKATKKKYAASKKIPKNLRKLPGLMFPVQVIIPEGSGDGQQ